MCLFVIWLNKPFNQTGLTMLLNAECKFFSVFIVSPFHLFISSLSLTVRSSQCADVSSLVPMLKALFFSRCGPGCPSSLKTRLFLNWNKQPFSLYLSLSLSFSLSSSIRLLLSRKQNGWVGTGMHHLTPAQSTQPEVTEA